MRLYPAQILLAVLGAALSSYWIYQQHGWTETPVSVFLVTYVIFRISLATLSRTRVWLKLGSRRYRTRLCPDCGQRIYRIPGDWILQCKRCGWKEGLPVIRWLTHSVPIVQLRRSVSSSAPLLVAIAAVLIVVHLGVLGAILPTQEASIPSVTGTAQSTTASDVDRHQSFNETLIERKTLELVNDRRTEEGMRRLVDNPQATEKAREHARDMARNNYFSHTSMDGETQLERYSFCDGGENIHQTWVNRRIQLSTGESTVLTTEEEVAENVVFEWMQSDPHRERGILGSPWASAGVGIAITSDGKGYAVLGFCS